MEDSDEVNLIQYYAEKEKIFLPSKILKLKALTTLNRALLNKNAALVRRAFKNMSKHVPDYVDVQGIVTIHKKIL